MRILALGTATYDVAQKITVFCGEMDRKCNKIFDEYMDSTNPIAEKHGYDRVNMFRTLDENVPIRVEMENNTLIIELDESTVDPENNDTGYFELQNANIICGQLNSDMTILCHELAFQEDNNDRLVLSLLCQNSNGEFSEFSVSFS